MGPEAETSATPGAASPRFGRIANGYRSVAGEPSLIDDQGIPRIALDSRRRPGNYGRTATGKPRHGTSEVAASGPPQGTAHSRQTGPAHGRPVPPPGY